MSRRVKEFVEIADCVSLDELIARLSELRDNLPDGADAELRLRGDEVFGRRITISYFRAQTADEAALERRYSKAARESKAKKLGPLQAERGKARAPARPKRDKLRIVA